MNSSLPKSQVFFRTKQATTDWLVEIVDMLLIPWVRLETAHNVIGANIRAYIKAFEQAEFNEDPLFAFFKKHHGKSFDFRSAINQMQHLLGEIDYHADEDISLELCQFLELHALDSGEWREDEHREWVIDGDDLNHLFRLLLWTLRQFERIAELSIKHFPEDVSIQGLLAHLRGVAYQSAESLADFSLNPLQVRLELGGRRFCPRKSVMQFWQAVGLLAPPPPSPIDAMLQPAPLFLRYLLLAEQSLGHHKQARRSELAALMRINNLVRQLNDLNKAWESAQNDHFYLGPTLKLLQQTTSMFAEIESELKSGESEQDSTPSSELQEAIKQFEIAASALKASLIA